MIDEEVVDAAAGKGIHHLDGAVVMIVADIGPGFDHGGGDADHAVWIDAIEHGDRLVVLALLERHSADDETGQIVLRRDFLQDPGRLGGVLDLAVRCLRMEGAHDQKRIVRLVGRGRRQEGRGAVGIEPPQGLLAGEEIAGRGLQRGQ